MEQSKLNPGDKVVPLAGLVMTTSVISGGIISAIVTWKFDHSWWLPIIAFIAGAILCGVTAKLIGLFVFPATENDHVFVVKAGSSALPLTLKAALIGSISGLFIAGFIYAFTLGGTTLVVSTWGIVTVVSLIIGGLWGTLSALL